MNFFVKYAEMVVIYLIENPENSISVKKLRIHYKIKSSNRSLINFFWRVLVLLRNNHYLQESTYKSTYIPSPKLMKLIHSNSRDQSVNLIIKELIKIKENNNKKN